jgi:ATP synthase protein I
MQSEPRHSGEMSHDSAQARAHRTGVDADARKTATGSPGSTKGDAPVLRPALDPAARTSRRMYEGLSASSAGLELGIAVAIGALFGRWLDGKLGTEPWMLLAFLAIGLVAGFRGVLRAVARADRAAQRSEAEDRAGQRAGQNEAKEHRRG